MRTRWVGWALALGLVFVATGAGAQLVVGYRWVDEQGNVHYAGRRDQVPERYRPQLTPEGSIDPPKPRLPDASAPSRKHARSPLIQFSSGGGAAFLNSPKPDNAHSEKATNASLPACSA